MNIEKPRDRLKLARLCAGYKTPSEAARAVKDINLHTLNSHENGNREISRKSAIKYGEAFKASPGWLLYGEKNETSAFLDEKINQLLTKASERQKSALLELLYAYLIPDGDSS